jgi:Neuraminidase (sialidase)
MKKSPPALSDSPLFVTNENSIALVINQADISFSNTIVFERLEQNCRVVRVRVFSVDHQQQRHMVSCGRSKNGEPWSSPAGKIGNFRSTSYNTPRNQTNRFSMIQQSLAFPVPPLTQQP